MEIRNLVIDRPLRGIMLSPSTNEVWWSINQIETPALNMTAETLNAVDATGVAIMSFDRSKSGEFTGSNSILDLGLLAAQSGSELTESSASRSVICPCFEEIEYPATGTEVTLKHTPVGTAAEGIGFIYKLNGDGSVGKKFSYAAAAAADKFTFTDTTLSLPTDASLKGSRMLVIYDYAADETDKALAITNNAVDFPKTGKFVLEVLTYETCDPETKYFAYLIFPQAKLDSNYSLDFTTEGKHPFTLKLMQSYCDYEKKLFSFVVPDAE